MHNRIEALEVDALRGARPLRVKASFSVALHCPSTTMARNVMAFGNPAAPSPIGMLAGRRWTARTRPTRPTTRSRPTFASRLLALPPVSRWCDCERRHRRASRPRAPTWTVRPLGDDGVAFVRWMRDLPAKHMSGSRQRRSDEVPSPEIALSMPSGHGLRGAQDLPRPTAQPVAYWRLRPSQLTAPSRQAGRRALRQPNGGRRTREAEMLGYDDVEMSILIPEEISSSGRRCCCGKAAQRSEPRARPFLSARSGPVSLPCARGGRFAAVAAATTAKSLPGSETESWHPARVGRRAGLQRRTA